ncbi:cell division protein SepF [Chamaesiphon sp. OTE_20_metabat_361]|uniref:cell division protein SepF n=1 Tax=Chamaesiphon sp. OTE_20_metabat_361 TaxID=2964689 RepID=UPI00286A2A99|nr:cell division protein SepF [Chamaesiphon sp. OTE_20_metabat_361]
MNVITKFKDFMGLNEEEYNDYDETDNDAYRSEYQQPEPTVVQPTEPESRGFRRASDRSASKINNVVGMPGIVHGVSEMILIEPRSFEEMPQVIDALRHRKSVILNMTLIRQEEAQRSVDFVAGGTYAIDGHYERIGDNIFLFTPNCVQVSTPANTTNDVVERQATTTARTNRISQPMSNWGSEPISVAQ